MGKITLKKIDILEMFLFYGEKILMHCSAASSTQATNINCPYRSFENLQYRKQHKLLKQKHRMGTYT